jgi:hypothetical protein
MKKKFSNSIRLNAVDKILRLLILFFITTSITSCGLPDFAKPSKVSKDTPVNAKERARKNVTEGRGVSLKGMMSGSRSTNYEFSTSNPLWRASLEIIDFMPLNTVDYSGGIIVTDWYNDSENLNESIKITVRFLSNDIRSDSIKIIVHNKKCKTNQNCEVNEIDSSIKFELQKSILSKAVRLEKETKTSK